MDATFRQVWQWFGGPSVCYRVAEIPNCHIGWNTATWRSRVRENALKAAIGERCVRVLR
jgi:hypothetical protein